MNRLKFYQVNGVMASGLLETSQPFVFNGGFLIVNHLVAEKMFILFDITKGLCLDYIKTDNKKEVKDLLISYGVKFEIEKRKKI